MNKFLNLFTAILFISTAILISCGGSDPVTPVVDPQDTQGELLAAGTTSASTVNVDNIPASGIAEGWENFTLSFTYNSADKGGTFSTTNSQSDLVWASSGTWKFKGTGSSIIERTSNGATTEMDLNVSASDLTLSFNVVDNGRILTFGGDWVFGMKFN